MAPSLEIATDLLDRLCAEAVASPRAEVCGLLFGDELRITTARACRNVHPQPASRFEIDPTALLAAHRAARLGDPRMIGSYHSHPSGEPVPSITDARAAAPDGSVWLIVTAADARGWRAVADGAVHGRFDPVTLRPTGCASATAPPSSAQAEPIHAQGEPMTISPVDFASLLCSRLCHDLLSPIGALNNGLELLADERDPAMRERCMELLADSARTSANKLKFFRLAFGAAGGFGEAVDARDARGAVEGLLGENKRLELGWLVEEETLPKPAAKVLLNLAMIAGDALVRGGRLDIGAERSDAGALEIVLRAQGQRVVLAPELREALTQEATVTARTAAAHLVHAIVAEAGGSVQVIEPEPGILLLGAMFPTARS